MHGRSESVWTRCGGVGCVPREACAAEGRGGAGGVRREACAGRPISWGAKTSGLLARATTTNDHFGFGSTPIAQGRGGRTTLKPDWHHQAGRAIQRPLCFYSNATPQVADCLASTNQLHTHQQWLASCGPLLSPAGRPWTPAQGDAAWPSQGLPHTHGK